MSYRIITDFANEKSCYPVPVFDYVPHESSNFVTYDQLVEFSRGHSCKTTDEILGPDYGRVVGDQPIRGTQNEVSEAKCGRDKNTPMTLREQFPRTCFDDSDVITIPPTTTPSFGAYAPLLPAVLMATNFVISVSLAYIIDKINTVLIRRNIPFRYFASNCTWECSHINRAESCRFDIHVYRPPNHDEERKGKHTVEVHRLKGDGWFIGSILEDLRAELDIDYIKPVPFADDYGIMDTFNNTSATEQSTSATEQSTSATEQPLSPELPLSHGQDDGMMICSDYDASSAPKPPTEEDFKKLVVDMLHFGDSCARLEAAQMVTAMYGANKLSSPSNLDKRCAIQLMKIVCTSSTTDYASQHAMITLSEMSESSEYCDVIIEAQVEATDNNSFCEFIFGQATMKDPSFNEEDMKLYSGIVLAYLLKYNCSDVLSLIPKSAIPKTEVANDVKKALQIAWKQSPDLRDIKDEVFRLLEEQSQND